MMPFSVPRRLVSVAILTATTLAIMILLTISLQSTGRWERHRNALPPVMRDFAGETLMLPVDQFRQGGYAYATFLVDETQWTKLEVLVQVRLFSLDLAETSSPCKAIL